MHYFSARFTCWENIKYAIIVENNTYVEFVSAELYDNFRKKYNSEFIYRSVLYRGHVLTFTKLMKDNLIMGSQTRTVIQMFFVISEFGYFKVQLLQIQANGCAHTAFSAEKP